MEVTFTKVTGRRCWMRVARQSGPPLSPRQGPGYHDYLPHDAVHFIVEAEAGLAGGVFGRIARGETNIFAVADQTLQRRVGRREARRAHSPADHEDMARAELLASVCQAIWELRAGQRTERPEWLPADTASVVAAELMERILAKLSRFADQWHQLPPGADGITLTWPSERA